MFELAALAHDRGLAVALRLRRLDAERRDAAPTEQFAQLFADRDQLVEVLAVATGIWIDDHGNGHRLAGGRLDRTPHLAAGLFDVDDELADLDGHESLCFDGTTIRDRPCRDNIACVMSSRAISDCA